MGMTEYEDEPVEGLPERLPDGETMVWQGRPTVAAMAKRVFYIPHLALYFGLLIAGHTVYRLMEGVSAAQVMRDAGVPGVRYFDMGSRSSQRGTRNYVMFPGTEDRIRILRKYGLAPATLGAEGLLNQQPQESTAPAGVPVRQ